MSRALLKFQLCMMLKRKTEKREDHKYSLRHHTVRHTEDLEEYQYRNNLRQKELNEKKSIFMGPKNKKKKVKSVPNKNKKNELIKQEKVSSNCKCVIL